MNKNMPFVTNVVVAGLLTFGVGTALAGDDDKGNSDACKGLPSWSALKGALIAAQGQMNGGFNLEMWGTIVNRDGVVCSVAFTGGNRGDQWPGSRVISAQKANTANAFSLPGLALSTANLYSAVQPGGSLYGLQASNPVDTDVAYGGNSANNGQANDPMVGKKIGGVNVFGGGLALYNAAGKLLGALGVSGDTSCADHNIAWLTRATLGFDHVPAGVAAAFAIPPDTSHKDNIIFDITPQAGQMPGVSASSWGHPHCGPGSPDNETTLASNLPPTK